MEFNIPSFANDYNFVVCYKANPSQEIWEFYGVADTMNQAQNDVKNLRDFNADTLVIINISNYEKGKK